MCNCNKRNNSNESDFNVEARSVGLASGIIIAVCMFAYALAYVVKRIDHVQTKPSVSSKEVLTNKEGIQFECRLMNNEGDK
jgi:hypothetical protein